jgi:hypothetical protein
MIKLDPSPISLERAADPYTDIESTHQLIVLLPSGTNYSAMTRRIWELANTTCRNVQLLSLCKDPAEEQSLRRRLITMASLLQDGRICVEVRVAFGTNWVAAVREIYRTGDRIVCFAEQRAGLLQRPLSQILESNLRATLYVLSDPTPEKSKSSKLSQLLYWFGFLVTLVGFGLLQTKILQLPESSFQSILLILSILPEFWLIWVWNSLFG